MSGRDDWAPGDLALCVRSGEETRRGSCYTVSEVKEPGSFRYGSLNIYDHALLRFVGLPPRHHRDWSGANRFIKVTPPADMENEVESIALEQRKTEMV